MTIQTLVAVLLILAGLWLAAPIAVVLGIVSLVLEIARAVWARHALANVRYRRTLARDRTAWGEQIPLQIEVWNRSPLPLAWLRADDEVSLGVVIRERSIDVGERGGFTLRNAWTLAPFERVIRHFHAGADRRGVFELGPVDLSVGDLFARDAGSEAHPEVDRFLVRPRAVPASSLRRRDQVGGVARATAGLAEDPSRFAGVREYAPGDPLRRIHARTSARLGRPMTKRFEPSREREVLIALDVQTSSGPSWEIAYDEDAVESLIVIAASLARSLAEERAAFGLVAAGYTGAESRFAHLPVSAAPGQVGRVFDLLARLSSHPSASFERLLSMVVRTARPGTTVVIVTVRDPIPFAAHLRRLERAGCEVLVVACGRSAAADVARARSAGFAARVAQLDGPWRTAGALAISR